MVRFHPLAPSRRSVAQHGQSARFGSGRPVVRIHPLRPTRAVGAATGRRSRPSPLLDDEGRGWIATRLEVAAADHAELGCRPRIRHGRHIADNHEIGIVVRHCLDPFDVAVVAFGTGVGGIDGGRPGDRPNGGRAGICSLPVLRCMTQCRPTRARGRGSCGYLDVSEMSRAENHPKKPSLVSAPAD